MKRRLLLLLAGAAIMICLAALAQQRKPGLLLLEWAAKASQEKPPVAVLIEMGLKDDKPAFWTGAATVAGARVVHREGYRFRTDDKLVDPGGWEASSHRALRVPKGPTGIVLARTEGVATVGVVLHLADVEDDATLTIDVEHEGKEKVAVPLKGVLAGHAKPVWDGAAAVRLISTATPVVTARTEDDFPAAAYGPDGTLWLAYISYTVRDESRRIEQPDYKEQPKDFKSLYTPEFADQLFVRYYRNGKWSEPIGIAGPNEDLVRCAVAVEGNGTAWVVYSANRDGVYNLYGRSILVKDDGGAAKPAIQVGAEERLTANPGPDLSPVMCTTQAGQLRVAYQRWLPDGEAVIHVVTRKDGKWKPGFDEEGFVGKDFVFSGGASRTILFGRSAGEGNSWNPGLAPGPNGEWTIALDGYQDGDYDAWIHTIRPKSLFGDPDIAASSSFEARPSISYDPQGRLWIAYEEGPEQWGKDYGALVPGKGNPLYNERSVRVVCLQGGKLFRPVAELPTGKVEIPPAPHEAVPARRFETTPRYAYPKIGIDGKGRVWLTYREKFGTRYSTHPGSYWLTFARRLDGNHWSEPIELHHSDGLLDSRPVLLPHAAGGLLVLHNTDGRYTMPETIDNQVYMSYVDLPGDPVEPKLVPHEPSRKDEKLVKQAEQERADVKRMHDYRVEAAGKKYQLLRGEFHRHTEISWDGGPDGSLEDMFRYAIDAASLDWIGNTDHDNGAGREYPWWLTQKLTDAYHVKDVFTPMFSYERSVAYPNGHRNCVFAKRGVRTLPRLGEADPAKRVGGVHPDDTKMLYRYLHELGGVCASHTSATTMGTDWRDNDPAVEPLVEIYQGDRMSYEKEEGPRAGHDPKSGDKPVSIGGWRPDGFIDHALDQKGYHLGFESSSDHWSTHISFTVVLAEGRDRPAILDAMRKRHSYAATDNIVLDVRSGGHLMGDEFKSGAAPALEVRVIGTGPVARLHILRDSDVVDTIKPEGKEYRGTWTDAKPVAGKHYYYVRVEQADGQLAWGSPLWIEYAP
jgi:hypothetical protein